MLVLRRLTAFLAAKYHRPKEKRLYIVGPDNGVITIDVLGIEGERVKLGFDAPPQYLVMRAEVAEKQYPSHAH